MDIYQTLEEEHEDIKDLLDKLSESSSEAVKTREKTFSQLESKLIPHEKAEEKTFYVRLMDSDHRDDALEALEEHHAAEMLLKEVKKTAPDDERWLAKMKVLRETVNHHIEEEESTIFDDAKEILDDDEAETIGREFSQQERQIASRT